jgi:hypothetical protein
VSGKKTNYLGWMRYYTGRFFQLVGLLLVLQGLMANFASANLHALLYFTVAGLAVFTFGWFAARKNPEG